MNGLAEARATLADLAAAQPIATGAVALRLPTEPGFPAELTLSHPEARNAVTFGMMVALADAVVALRGWDGAVVVVRAPGKVFCAGGHVPQLRQVLAEPSRAAAMGEAMASVLDALLTLPQVSVAAVDGLALGGGAELVTACDHRVLGVGARIRFVHAALGIAPGWGGAARLVRHVGARSALRLLSSAAELGPEDALAVGLADAVCPDAADPSAFLAPLLAHPPEAIRAVKRQVLAAAPLRRAGEEASIFAEVWGGPAHRAALARGRS